MGFANTRSHFRRSTKVNNFFPFVALSSRSIDENWALCRLQSNDCLFWLRCCQRKRFIYIFTTPGLATFCPMYQFLGFKYRNFFHFHLKFINVSPAATAVRFCPKLWNPISRVQGFSDAQRVANVTVGFQIKAPLDSPLWKVPCFGKYFRWKPLWKVPCLWPAKPPQDSPYDQRWQILASQDAQEVMWVSQGRHPNTKKTFKFLGFNLEILRR